MTRTGLALRSALFHWRGNLAVMLGVAVGAAVLTGALLVGDSLRGSLRDLTLQRLGWVDYALLGGRFIREEAANGLPGERVCPAILLQGAASSATLGNKVSHRSGRVVILGIDDRFWNAGDDPAGMAFWQPKTPEKLDETGVVLNAALAHDLNAAEGDCVTLQLQRASDVPRESLLGRREANDVLAGVTLRVRAVLPEDSPGSRFSLNPTTLTPRNAFVPLRVLQTQLFPQKRGAPKVDDRRINAILVQRGSREALQEQLAKNLKLDDWGLFLRDHPRRQYLSVESRQMILDPAAAKATIDAARETGLRAAPTLVYLANTIADGKTEIPYSVVAALDPNERPPLGPFLPPGIPSLGENDVVLADWKESPLHAKPGDPIMLRYFSPEDQGGLKEITATFHLRGFVPMEGAAADPGLAPELPGLTDRLSMGEWDPPFPYNGKRVQRRDEDYWNKYRTTPKAYVSLPTGQRLWGSRFGNLTSVRVCSDVGDLAAKRDAFENGILQHLRPEQGGLTFDAVRQRGLEASTGGTDFGELFLYFSFFLIVAALLLVGLLFRLNLDRRAAEFGLLLSTGYRRRTVLGLLLLEGTAIAAVGGVLGLVVAVLYAQGLLGYLKAWWPGGQVQSFLRLHVSPLSMVIGYVATLAVSLGTILWAVWGLRKVAPSALLAGVSASDTGVAAKGPRWSYWIAGVCCVLAFVCLGLGWTVQAGEERAFTFFSSGALLLTGLLAAFWAFRLRRPARHGTWGHGLKALARFGMRNAGRNPLRSLLTAGLLAAAVFLVVAVEAFRREPGTDYLKRDSGSGGFTLLGESEVPILQNLNSDDGRAELNFPDSAPATLREVSFVSLRLHAGDDASCLNLYQPTRPRLLGMPHGLVERGGFQFQSMEAHTAEDRANPWRLLEQECADNAIPVFGEANTVQWILKSKLGGELTVPDQEGRPVKLRIVGLLEDSVFQSGLLLSEKDFLRLYPLTQGYRVFLIDAPPQRAGEVRALLETVLAPQGMEVASTEQRLAEYLAVENTYLSTFQALGGLGLLLGALGLAVVLLRGVWERRGELALLRAMGYRRQALGGMVLAENAFLLLVGLIVGVLSAVLSVAPHLQGTGGELPVVPLLGLLGLVLLVGLAAGAAAVAATLRTPLLPALREE